MRKLLIWAIVGIFIVSPYAFGKNISYSKAFPKETSINKLSIETVNIKETKGGTKNIRISGCVKYYINDTPKPVKYAVIKLCTLWNNEIETTYTDSSGHFVFNITEGGWYLLKVCSDTHENSGHDAVCVRPFPYGLLPPYEWWSLIRIENDIFLDYICVGSEGAWEIYHNILDAYDWFKEKTGWNRSKVNCCWPYPFINRPRYNADGDLIEIPSEWEDHRPAIIHEYAHAIMWKAYGNSFPPSEHYGEEHTMKDEKDGGFALIEGWANFIPCAVDNVDYYGIEFTNFADSEYSGFGDWDGNSITGAVAGIFWDIFDRVDASDHPLYSHKGDYISNAFDKIWIIIKNDNPKDMLDFWRCWENRWGWNWDLWQIYFNHRILIKPKTGSMGNPLFCLR